RKLSVIRLTFDRHHERSRGRPCDIGSVQWKKLPTLIALTLCLGLSAEAQVQRFYLGMDRNDYPGDAAMAALHKTFAFTGYWLNTPPGADRNTWVGKRQLLQSAGYGFLLLFNGREYAK